MKLIVTSLLLSGSLFCTALAAENVADRKFYFDFGATSTAANPCDLTVSPDINGNYWNNITNDADNTKYAYAGTSFSTIVDSSNGSSTLKLTLNDRFSTNGRSSGGGLTNPSADLLGDFAVATATGDYFYNEADQNNIGFTVSGLNPAKGYKFFMFGTRNASDTRTGNYALSGYNSWNGNMTVAGSGIGANGENQNTSKILESDYIFPDADGNIKMVISKVAGSYIPLNVMKIEEYSGVDRPVMREYISVTLTGTAADGKKVVINRDNLNGKEVNTFSGAADFAAGTFTITAKDENGVSYTFGGENGSLSENGAAISVSAYPTVISIDLDMMSYTLTPIQKILMSGSASKAGWSNTNGETFSYDGDLNFNWSGKLEGNDTSTDSGRVVLYINGTWTGFKRSGVDENYNAILALNGADDIPINPGSYKMNFNLGTGVLKVENGLEDLDAMRITAFGSSVCNGQGASQISNQNQGYIMLYGNQLAERFENGASDNEFYISNISINGNSTVNLLKRYDDMRREFGKYVIFGVSLGNEGIHESTDKQATYNQFADNMHKLIDMVRADGKVPVVCNNYTRGDFNASDYEYILKMDKEIGLWDVPSINLLGAIDSKTGLWASGYQYGDDIYHPNQLGHQEFAYAMVPSLFDALESGKELVTERLAANGEDISNVTLSATPEGKLHSFSLAITGKGTASSGTIADVELADGSKLVLSYDNGSITASTGDKTLKANADFSDNTLVTLNYTYASRYLDMDVYNGGKQSDRVVLTGVEIEPVKFVFDKSPVALNEILLYRSALSANDVASLAAGELQKGSLEIYTTFNTQSADGRNNAEDIEISYLRNHAMSLNAIEKAETAGISGIIIPETDAASKYYTVEGIEVTNPVKGNIYIQVKGNKTKKVVF